MTPIIIFSWSFFIFFFFVYTVNFSVNLVHLGIFRNNKAKFFHKCHIFTNLTTTEIDGLKFLFFAIYVHLLPLSNFLPSQSNIIALDLHRVFRCETIPKEAKVIFFLQGICFATKNISFWCEKHNFNMKPQMISVVRQTFTPQSPHSHYYRTTRNSALLPGAEFPTFECNRRVH